MVYPVLNVLPCSFDSDPLFYYQLQQLIGEYSFRRSIMFISSAPEVLFVPSCQPINQNRHGTDYWHWAVIIKWNSFFGFICNTCERLFVMVEAVLATKQRTFPSSENIAIYFLGVSCCCTLEPHISQSISSVIYL